MLDYLPAISVDLNIIENILKNNKGNQIGKFFSSITALKNRYLISYGISHDQKDIKNRYDIKWILGDSGGFQLVQKAYKRPELEVSHITPEKVLNWLESECDCGMNLDLPPFIESKNYDSVYEECLKKSLENFSWFEKNRKRTNFILYNIVHGRNFDYIDRWYNEVKKFNFEGWALSLFPTTDPVFLSLQMCYMDEILRKDGKKIEDYPIHVLGAASVNNALMLLHFNTYRKIKLITTDTSTHAIGARFRIMIRNVMSTEIDDDLLKPTVTNGIRFFEGVNLNELEESKSSPGYNEYEDFVSSGCLMPCNCYSCKLWNELICNEKDLKIQATVFSELLNWHNVSCMNDIVYRFNVMAMNNGSYFRKYVDDMCLRGSKIFKDSIELQRLYFEKGVSVSKLLTKYNRRVDQIVSGIEEKNTEYQQIGDMYE